VPDRKLLGGRLAFQFYSGGPYPPEYHGAHFFADYSRDCIWVMQSSGGELPSPSHVKTFASGAANPVELQIGTGGDLFYADFDGGTIRRVTFTPANQPPTAVANGTPTTGSAPLTVQFDGSARATPTPATRSATPGTWTATASTTIRRRSPRATPTRARVLHRGPSRDRRRRRV
jgi:hypothetical protein